MMHYITPCFRSLFATVILHPSDFYEIFLLLVCVLFMTVCFLDDAGKYKAAQNLLYKAYVSYVYSLVK